MAGTAREMTVDCRTHRQTYYDGPDYDTAQKLLSILGSLLSTEKKIQVYLDNLNFHYQFIVVA